MKAMWNGTVLAESDATIELEGNQYFPVESVKKDYLMETNTHTTCPRKWVASYYTIKTNDGENTDAAWFYPAPSESAAEIKNYVAFWKGVEITE